ncbi:MAG: malectin domain-containing carbohydrate-binding protein [Verrucomicrobiia bacterium]
MEKSASQSRDISIIVYCSFRWFIYFLMLWFLGNDLMAQRYNDPVPPGTPPLRIVIREQSSSLEQFAARELRRYIYLRTGILVNIEIASKRLPEWGNLIVIGDKNWRIVRQLATDGWIESEMIGLEPQSYIAAEIVQTDRKIQLLTGGDEIAVLYAAYRFIENMGVRFYLHGDHLPEERLIIAEKPTDIPKGAELLTRKREPAAEKLKFFTEIGKPMFRLRGIQPFHDFPEGPDWWNYEDYMAILSQLPKLKMNFIGLHTYPEKRPNAEPTVWIGLKEDADENGNVKYAYPASYQNTLRGNWGYKAKKTGEFTFGSASLFERDDYGAEVMFGLMPEPTEPDKCNEVFNRTGDMLKSVFEYARILGIKTCVGTETPLVVPKLVTERLKSKDKLPSDNEVIKELYAGIFKRIMNKYPIDYYWFWTPEHWTWEGTKPEEVTNTINDLNAAIMAHKEVNPPFALATCGWVLGPQQDRALFDRVLPKDIAVSCINRDVGRTPVEKGFIKVKGRSKWAIPWLEDDPALTSPQLWAGRMRRDAADAYRYGCDGLMGIHWRTKILSPNILALAQAAWTQYPWNTNLTRIDALPTVEGPAGGKYAAFDKADISGTDDPVVYRTVRYDMSEYNFKLPNGKYTVTLKFCELHYNEKGKRIFGVSLQDKLVIEKLDIFEKVGKNRALDYRFENIQVTNEWLNIGFTYIKEFPAIAAIVIEGEGICKKINCGGPAYKDYAADWQPSEKVESPFAPVKDFYFDWAKNEFGAEAGVKAAQIFEKIDCKLPRPSDWVEGPGGMRPDNRQWEVVSKEYQFVREFESLKPLVKGKLYTERFNYWLNAFKYMESMGRLRCVWGKFTNELGIAKKEDNESKKKELIRKNVFPARREIINCLGEVYKYLLATLSTPGEMGTVANWEQHIYTDLLVKPGAEMEKILGEKLPPDLYPPTIYTGPTRLILPTVRTSLLGGEPFSLKLIVLSQKLPKETVIFYRKLGEGAFKKLNFKHLNRGVYKVSIEDFSDDDIEYYVRVISYDGKVNYFPTTAPIVNQTIVRIKK